jgi:hypothetical protein
MIAPLDQAGAQHSLSPMIADGGAVMRTKMLFPVPESLLNIAHLPKLNKSSSFR